MNIDFDKLCLMCGQSDGLVPAIVQDVHTERVLMLGYMNAKAFEQTKSTQRVTFYSRSKKRIWVKGETSGHFLSLKNILIDCDRDALLIKAEPFGPTCHRGTDSCFGENKAKGFIYRLQDIIRQRIDADDQDSYTNKIYRKGINKVAQKVGEEAVELVIEAKDDNKKLFVNEAADLIYHLLILLKCKKVSMEEVENVLKKRHKVQK